MYRLVDNYYLNYFLSILQNLVVSYICKHKGKCFHHLSLLFGLARAAGVYACLISNTILSGPPPDDGSELVYINISYIMWEE